MVHTLQGASVESWLLPESVDCLEIPKYAETSRAEGTRTAVPLSLLSTDISRVLHMARSPDGDTVVTAAADETIRFWKVFQQSNTPKKNSEKTNGLFMNQGIR